jgi:hypothetical protein
LLLSLNLGLAAAGLFIVAGLLYRRLGTTRFHRLGGLFDAAPLLGLTFLVVVLGSIAMPGTPGFEAAHLALEGVFESYGWGVAIVAASGNVLAAGYLLWAYQRIFLARNPKGVTLAPGRSAVAGIDRGGSAVRGDHWRRAVRRSVDRDDQRGGGTGGASVRGGRRVIPPFHHCRHSGMEGEIWMADDFDEPIDDLFDCLKNSESISVTDA